MFERSPTASRSLLRDHTVSLWDPEAQKEDPLLDGLEIELGLALENEWSGGVDEALEILEILLTARLRARFSTEVN